MILGTKLEALRPNLVTLGAKSGSPGAILTLRPLDAKLGTWEGNSELPGAKSGALRAKPSFGIQVGGFKAMPRP